MQHSRWAGDTCQRKREAMKVLFVAGFGPIVPDMNSGRAFYGDALGLPLEGDASYLSTTDVAVCQPSPAMVRAHRPIPDKVVSPSVAYAASVTGARTMRDRGDAHALWP